MSENIPNSGESAESSRSPPEQRKPRHRAWIWGLLALALGVGAFLYFHRPPPKPKPPPPPVSVTAAAARMGDIGVYVNAIGLVTPLQTVKVTSFATGQLLNVHYREGQMVSKGDLLLEIDPAPYQAQLTAAQGQYDRDKALLEEARIDLQRFQLAYTNHSIPKQQLDTQVALVRQDEGTLKFDLGQVQNAEVQLAYTRIASPVTGQVGLRLVDPGNAIIANSATGLVVVTQMQPITVIFSVAEDYLPQIQAQLPRGQPMQVEIFDRTQKHKLATGALLTLDNQIDVATGTVRLKAIFGNEDGALFPNQFVNARLLIETQRGVTLVPASALQMNPQGAFVYVVKPDHTASVRAVAAGTTDGSNTAVKGVSPGEIVILDNFNRLQEGAKVAPRPAPQTAHPGGGP